MSFRFNRSATVVIAVLLVLCFALVCCGCTGDGTVAVDSGEEKASEALQSLKSGVSSSLSETLALAKDTSEELTTIDRNQMEVNDILDDSYKSLPWVESAAFINTAGVVVAIMPDTYSDLVGKDLSYQVIVKTGLTNQSPVMSDYMELEDGEKGIVLEYPVFSEDGEFAGLVSLVIDPAKLVGPCAEEIRSEYGYSVMVAQPDALILYDEDAGEIGNETFGNPMYEDYPEIIECAEIYSSQTSGTYSYVFKATGSDKEVQKQALWDTAEVLDKEWRLMVIKEL